MDPVKVWLDAYESARNLAEECEADALAEQRHVRKAYLESEASRHWERAEFYWSRVLMHQAVIANRANHSKAMEHFQ